MASSKHARCSAAFLFAALLLLSYCSAARRLEEEAPAPAEEGDYPDVVPESPPPEDELAPPPASPEFELPPFFPEVHLPPMPEMPSIPGFHFAAAEPQAADEP